MEENLFRVSRNSKMRKKILSHCLKNDQEMPIFKLGGPQKFSHLK